jgi:hypothetical protein
MKLYLVTAPDNKQTWGSSQSDAAAARKKFTADGAKRADLKTFEVEVPTGKADLLQFLNDYQGDALHLVATRNLTAS